MPTLLDAPDQVTAVRVPITIDVDSVGYKKIVDQIPGSDPEAMKFENFMNTLCADFAAGGMMLSPEDMARIYDVKPEATPDDIIEAFSEAAGMEDGQMVVKWLVDPSYIGPMQQAAETQGVTVDQMVQNLMNHAINEGWFFALDPMPKPILMTPNDYEDLAKLVGKQDFTGTELVAFIRKAVGEFSLDDLPVEETAVAQLAGQGS